MKFAIDGFFVMSPTPKLLAAALAVLRIVLPPVSGALLRCFRAESRCLKVNIAVKIATFRFDRDPQKASRVAIAAVGEPE